MEFVSTKSIELDFATLYFHDNYIVSIVKEGEFIDIDKAMTVYDTINTHFKGDCFTYISYRKNSYSIDPTLYKNSSYNNAYKAIAVVTNREVALDSSKLEKRFVKDDFKTFTAIQDAIDWANYLAKK